MKDADYSKLPILSAYDVFPNEKEKDNCFIFALASDTIICWSLKKKNISFEVEIDNIEDIKETKEHPGIEIIVKKKTPKMIDIKDRRIALFNCDPQLNGFVLKKAKEVRESYIQQQRK